MLASVDSAKRLNKVVGTELLARAQRQAERVARAQERIRAGLAGHKLGKHHVPEGEVDVQLGEELSESLRGLKVSVWRDLLLH